MHNRTAIGNQQVRRGGAAPSNPLRVGAEAEDERGFVWALRARDESAFVTLIDRYHANDGASGQVIREMLHIAEEVVQETWLGVLRRLDRFEARSSLKRWISVIVINQAGQSASAA